MVEQCALELLANGTAARILVISDCGAHSCDVENHLFTSGREPLVSKGYGASSWEVTPDHQFLVTGGFTFEAADSESYVPPAPTGFALTYTDLDTGKVAEIAACIAPRLSPSGKWILCRTFNGSVARILTSGGTLEIIVPVKLPEGVGIKIGGPFGDYPSPVVFISEEKFSYSLYLDTEEVSEHEVSWSD